LPAEIIAKPQLIIRRGEPASMDDSINILVAYISITASLAGIFLILASDKYIESVRTRVISSYCFLTEMTLRDRVFTAINSLSRTIDTRFNGRPFGRKSAAFAVAANGIVFTAMLVIIAPETYRLGFLQQPSKADILENFQIMQESECIQSSDDLIMLGEDHFRDEFCSMIELYKTKLNDIENSEFKRQWRLGDIVFIGVFLTVPFLISTLFCYLSLAITLWLIKLSSQLKRIYLMIGLLGVDILIAITLTALAIIIMGLLTLYVCNAVAVNLLIPLYPVAGFSFYGFLMSSLDTFSDITVISELIGIDLSSNSVIEAIKGVEANAQMQADNNALRLGILFNLFWHTFDGYISMWGSMLKLDYIKILSMSYTETIINWSITLSVFPTAFHGVVVAMYIIFPFVLEPLRWPVANALAYLEEQSTHTGRIIIGLIPPVVVTMAHALKIWLAE